MQTHLAAYLAVKIKSLAAEAVIIRKDENKFKLRHKAELSESDRSQRARRAWLGLKHHRRFDVRQEARAALLAYGMLRGTPYRSIEAKCWSDPDWRRVARIAFKYGSLGSEAEVAAIVKQWRSGQVELKQAA